MTSNLISSETYQYLYEKFGNDIQIFPLQDEASTRRYFLLESKTKKFVICLDNQVNEDFILLSDFFLDQNIRVPKVLERNDNLNLLILSWEGQKDLSSLDQDTYQKQIPDVLNLLLKIQKLNPPVLVKNRKFDTEKLMSEILLTESKFEIFKNLYNISTDISIEVHAFLEECAGYLSKHEVNVFTHRDFHSRNLLLNDEGSMTLIDFQDARMGVPQYDLASILYDAYYPLPRDFRIQMLAYFQKHSIGGTVKFKETFYLQSLQRSFKALGTYFRMVVDEKKDKFKPSILSCLDQLEEIVQLGMFSDALYIFVRSLRNELQKHPDFKIKIK
ncbi:MAG: phosphotransferase [Leptospira sp.]|nr:phosphotransferase [Leptospira sp.]